MLLMFVVGMGNLGWMLLLAAVMAAEKNLPWGRRLRTPLGSCARHLGLRSHRSEHLKPQRSGRPTWPHTSVSE